MPMTHCKDAAKVAPIIAPDGIGEYFAIFPIQQKIRYLIFPPCIKLYAQAAVSPSVPSQPGQFSLMQVKKVVVFTTSQRLYEMEFLFAT